MPFKKLTKVFSRRLDKSAVDALTSTFRRRVLMLCMDTFKPDLTRDLDKFWPEIHDLLKYLVGSPQLSQRGSPRNTVEDVVFYLEECSDAGFLDFVELIFKTRSHEATLYSSFISTPGPPIDHLVDKINDAFRFDDLPYSLTRFVQERQTKTYHRSTETYETNVTVAYPQVIRREDEATHIEAIEPALNLLRGKAFASANKEFLEALADYRRGDFGDCLTKCGSAFESTMKVICELKGIPYDANKDTAAPLVKNLLGHATNLESYFDQPLTIVATLRNRLSKSHGAGAGTREVPRHVAKYTINATASAILLLVEEFCP